MRKFHMNQEEREALLRDVKALVEIPTVYSQESSPGAPFGKEVAKGLEFVLELAQSFGFETKNYDGYMGEITIGQRGSETFTVGILCHVDVVAAGEGWETPPFEALLKEGKLYGRGSSDDKGPLIGTLYAMKHIQEKSLLPEDVSVKLLVGTNEEELWQDIPYYLDHAEQLPDVSIVPDAFFPLINCEKGLYDFDLVYRRREKPSGSLIIEEIHGGSGRNVVPAECICRLKQEGEENLIELKTTGKSAHAMAPEKGENAIRQMIRCLALTTEDEFAAACGTLLDDYYGEAAGFACEDAESGKLTCNFGTIRTEGDCIQLECNVRYPASLPFETIEAQIKKAFSPAGFQVEYVDKLPPIYFPKDSLLVKTLMEVYRRCTGDMESQPLSMGGATYARAIPKAVGFGAILPHEEEVAHQPNEFIAVESLLQAAELIYEAILALSAKRP
ncbi:MAG: Sapep family Mn(2+)-dependent dipeptidase [Firmicutes bacterium]|nr:Sapep family Mn(2+)-dependent dipeptidase [Bacillota bacterium]